MAEFCTCGAKLPEDALFCHKCGKPQREDLIAREEAAAAPPPQPPPPLPVPQLPPIGFHNGLAVRIGMLTGVLAFALSVLSGQLLAHAAFGMVWLVAAGFYAVFLYMRRTGQKLSVMHGAHLGWMSGIFGFLITTILLTVVMLALSDPSVLQAMREQLKASPRQEADINQMLDLIRSPQGIVMGLLGTFVLFTVLPACGGALGAKLLSRD